MTLATVGEEAQETPHAFASASSPSLHPETATEPPPQRRQQLATPAPEASPAFRVDYDREPCADLALGPPFDQVKAKRFQDDASGIPPLGVQEIRKDADGPDAPATKVTPDGNGPASRQKRNTEHLPGIGPVADDPERLIGDVREIAASRAASRP